MRVLRGDITLHGGSRVQRRSSRRSVRSCVARRSICRLQKAPASLLEVLQLLLPFAAATPAFLIIYLDNF